MIRDRLIIEHQGDDTFAHSGERCVTQFTREEVDLLLGALRAYRVRSIATTARRDRLIEAIERCRAEAP
jgi:hypothetical protein